MKKLKVLLVAGGISIISCMTAFAGEWKQDNAGWWYQNDDGSYPVEQWSVIDGDYYYFGDNGYMKTGWLATDDGKWYYLNPSGELRYEDLVENGTTYHFDENGVCTNPTESGIDFDSDYKSILDQELLEAEKRLMDRPSYREVYEEKIVYEHDVAPAEVKNRFGLADM